MSPTAVTFLVNNQPSFDLILPDDIPSQRLAAVLAGKYFATTDQRVIWSLAVQETGQTQTRPINPAATLAEAGVLNGSFCTLQAQPLGEGLAAVLVAASGVRFNLGDMTVIGRPDPAMRSSVDIDLLPLSVEKVISRRHAVITRSDDSFTLEDCSKLGVWINGEKTSAPTPLNPGDMIAFGPPGRGAVLTFQLI